MTLGRPGRVALGAVLGSVALWAALRDIDAATVVQVISTANPALALVALASTLAAVALVAVRWKLLLSGDRPGVSFWMLFRAVVIGQMLNIAMPLRVGEVARLYGVSVSGRLDPGLVLASLALEKVLEIAVFGAAAITMVVFVAMPADMAVAPLAWTAVPVVAAGALWITARFGPRLARRASSLSAVPVRLRQRLVTFSDSFAAGVSSTASLRMGSRLLGLSLAIVLLPALANQLMLYAFHLTLPVWTGLVLLLVLQVGSVPPSLPGRVGVFNYLIVVTLVSMDVDRVTAASYSVALYLIGYMPKLLLGALFMLRAPAVEPTAASGSVV